MAERGLVELGVGGEGVFAEEVWRCVEAGVAGVNIDTRNAFIQAQVGRKMASSETSADAVVMVAAWLRHSICRVFAASEKQSFVHVCSSMFA